MPFFGQSTVQFRSTGTGQYMQFISPNMLEFKLKLDHVWSFCRGWTLCFKYISEAYETVTCITAICSNPTSVQWRIHRLPAIVAQIGWMRFKHQFKTTGSCLVYFNFCRLWVGLIQPFLYFLKVLSWFFGSFFVAPIGNVWKIEAEINRNSFQAFLYCLLHPFAV